MPKVEGGSISAHRQATTERIFDAFGELIYTQGYDHVSLADVAAAAGISRTAIYNYFPDKESLIVTYTVRETAGYVSHLHDALREIDDPVDQLVTYIRMQVEYFSSNHLPPGPALQYLLPQEAHEKIIEHVSSLDRTLDQILRSGSSQGLFEISETSEIRPLVNACISRERVTAEGPDTLPVTVAFVLRALGVPEARVAEATA